MSVLIVGSIAFDTIITPFDNRKRLLGGACIYGSLACSLFCKPFIIGVVGKDFKDSHFNFLRKKGIDTSGIVKVNGKTFFWKGRYNYDMKTRQSLKTDLNVFENFNPEISNKHKNLPFLFLANIDPELQLKILNSMNNLKFSICDTMDYWIKNSKKNLMKVLKKVNCVVLNDEEIREFSGSFDLIKGAKFIQKIGPEYVIIKKGEYGASIFGPDFYFSIPSYPVENVIDPTGAGDTFGGAFIGYIAKHNKINKKIIKNAIAYANTIASFTVEDFGINKLSKITILDIKKRINKLKQIVIF